MMETRTRGERERERERDFMRCILSNLLVIRPRSASINLSASKVKYCTGEKGQHERNPSHSLYSVRTSARLDSTRFFDQLEWGGEKKKKNSIIFFNFSTFLFLLFVLPPLMDFVSVWTRGAA